MSYIYLAIAYTGSEKQSYQYSLDALAAYMQTGINAFSPIAHGHNVAKKHKLPTDFKYWNNLSLVMVQQARAVHVIVPPGWETRTLESAGVKAEVQFAKRDNKNVQIIALDGTRSHAHVDSGRILNILSGDLYAGAT